MRQAIQTLQLGRWSSRDGRGLGEIGLTGFNKKEAEMVEMENKRSKTPSILPETESAKCPLEVALNYSEELFSAYPQRDFAQPAVFVSGVVATLMRYPESVVKRVCSVSTGLPQTTRFLPSICEVREACEAIHHPPRSYMQTA